VSSHARSRALVDGTPRACSRSAGSTGASANQASRVDALALAPATADVLWFQVDGHVLGAQTAADYTETTLVDLTAAGGPTPALTAPGFLHGVARIR